MTVAERVLTSSLKECDAVALKHVMTLPRLAHGAAGEASAGARVEPEAHMVRGVPQAAEGEAVGSFIYDKVRTAELVAVG